MNFLVDAHLPRAICNLLIAAGHKTLHTSELPAGNQTTDRMICELSIKKHWVVISKDTDFYYSHVLKQQPWKLVLVRTGNLRARELNALFERQLPNILQALATHTLVEIDRATIQVVR